MQMFNMQKLISFMLFFNLAPAYKFYKFPFFYPSLLFTSLHSSVGSYVKLSGIHDGLCWFDMNISIGTDHIFINLVSV